MLAQAPGGYYKTNGAASPWWREQAATTGRPLRGLGGVTQGDPLSPTIFNVVVDAVVRHWINGLVAETAEKGDKE